MLPEYYGQIMVNYEVRIDQNVDQERLYQLTQQHQQLNRWLHYRHSPIRENKLKMFVRIES